jgi:UPF0716 family protein affecting phage T7 exclusion
MTRGKLVITAIAMLVVGFVSGFILLPVISPVRQAGTTAAALPAGSLSSDARSTQYFMANIDEARLVAAGCRDGSVRGGECVNAETAISTAESKERFKRFRAGQ